jgi:predicted RNA-binding protein YlqC (UPF0109 family)
VSNPDGELDASSPPPSVPPTGGGQAGAVLAYLARQLVDDPDGVKVEPSIDRGGVRLELFVAPGDMGKVIGRKGRIAQSIRAVVRATAAREGTHVFVDIVD